MKINCDKSKEIIESENETAKEEPNKESGGENKSRNFKKILKIYFSVAFILFDFIMFGGGLYFFALGIKSMGYGFIAVCGVAVVIEIIILVIIKRKRHKHP